MEVYKDTNERVHHLLLQMTHVVEMLDLLPKAPASNGTSMASVVASAAHAGEKQMVGILEEESGAGGDSANNSNRAGDPIRRGLPDRVFPEPLGGGRAAGAAASTGAGGGDLRGAPRVLMWCVLRDSSPIIPDCCWGAARRLARCLRCESNLTRGWCTQFDLIIVSACSACRAPTSKPTTGVRRTEASFEAIQRSAPPRSSRGCCCQATKILKVVFRAALSFVCIGV